MLTVIALTVVGVVAFVRRERLGLAPRRDGGRADVLFGLVALVVFAVRPFELVTVPPALGWLFLGARTLRRDTRCAPGRHSARGSPCSPSRR